MFAVYAGRFDPVTNGHVDVLRRAARIFEQVVVAVFDAPSDKTLFPTSQRVSMLQTCVQDMPGVSVEPFEGYSPTSSGIVERMPSSEAYAP
jgi:pantetheine-phosphate adenylyltransferase